MKRKLTSMLFTICLTSILLACSLYAWFVMNTTVRTGIIEGNVSNPNVSSIDIKYYYLNTLDPIDSTSNFNRYEIDVTRGENGLMPEGEMMSQFNNPQTDNKTSLLMCISYRVSVSGNYSLELLADGIYYRDLEEPDKSMVQSYTNNYLSNSLAFYLNPVLVSSDSKDYYQVSTKTNFVNLETRTKTNKLILDTGYKEANDNTNQETYVYYAIIDYDVELVNDLYTVMLQNCAGETDLSTIVLFKSDLTLEVI